MENKSCTASSEVEANHQESSQKFGIIVENNSHNEGLANDSFQNNPMYSGDTQKTGNLSEFQLVLHSTESKVNADLENLQNTMKQKDNDDNDDMGFLNSISQNSVFTLPSSDAIEIKSPGRLKIRNASSVLSNNDQALNSVLNAAPKDPKYKLLVDPQLKSLKDEVTTLIKQCIAKEDAIISFEKRLANSEKFRSELQKKCSTLEHEKEKLKKLLEEATDKYNSVQLELYAAKSSMDEDKKSRKVEMATKSDMAKQLAQISAQRDKLKTELQDLKNTLEDSQANHKKVVQDLKSEYKVAIKQKEELIDVLKKQMRLANNLKRQLMHFKAAISQSYVEKEVLKAAENSFEIIDF
ncbi:hypothetical protein JTE90_029370 [Oedothorax gibbosus]|uniref:Testis expressed 9 n=1 Tax=Oedothorax gibbosus TaxID=931172 RepID=A0AAV6VPE3_9ARAC|nr:hypothetical protein JTE90_029370 [Oedothorax gibbosus]